MVSPPPIRTSFLEKDATGKLTGMISWPWVKWLEELYKNKPDFSDLILALSIQETQSVDFTEDVSEQVVLGASRDGESWVDPISELQSLALSHNDTASEAEDILGQVMVMVDTPLPFSAGGTSSGNFADYEIATGAINGLNVTFTLANTPNPSTSVYGVLNGVVGYNNAGGDFTVAGNTVTYAIAPPLGATLWFSYRY